MEVVVYNINGEQTGKVAVPEELLAQEVSRSLMHRIVVSYEANKRQGSANTKTRGDRRGSGKKLWRQKGTGRARMGSVRSPIWRGGGVIFGPKPKDFRMKTSQKERLLALQGALVGKLKDSEISLIDSLSLPEAKTKVVAKFIKAAGLESSVLFVAAERNQEWLRASGNIAKLNNSPLSDLNAYDLLKSKNIVMEKAAFEKLIGGAA